MAYEVIHFLVFIDYLMFGGFDANGDSTDAVYLVDLDTHTTCLHSTLPVEMKETHAFEYNDSLLVCTSFTKSDKENLHKDAQKVHAKKVSAFRKLMSSTESEENISIRDPQGSDPMKGLDRVDERLSEDEARKIVSNDRSEEVDRVEDRPTKFQDSQNKIRGSPDENDDHISSSSKSQSDALEKIVEDPVKRSLTEEVYGELEPAGKKRRISERLKTRDRTRLVKRFQRLTRRELG